MILADVGMKTAFIQLCEMDNEYLWNMKQSYSPTHKYHTLVELIEQPTMILKSFYK